MNWHAEKLWASLYYLLNPGQEGYMLTLIRTKRKLKCEEDACLLGTLGVHMSAEAISSLHL